MKKKPLCFIALITMLCLASCEKPGPQEKTIQTKITDAEGTPVEETYPGMLLRLSAEEFRDMNKENIFQKGAKLLIDDVPAQIKEAKEDYILLDLPVLNYEIPRRYRIWIQHQQYRFRLCDACLIYRPRVSGGVFSGISGGVSDGTFQMPAEMTLDAAGNLYVIDQRTDHDVIIRVTPAGVAAVFAGAGGEFGRLTGIDIDGSRNLMYVSDASAQQVKAVTLTAPATVTVVAGSGVVGNTNGTGAAASFNFGTQWVSDFGTNEQGQGLVVDAAGNIYVGEKFGMGTGNSQIRRITPAGVVTTVPGSTVEVTGEDAIVLPTGVGLNGAGEIVSTCGGIGPFHGVARISSGAYSRFVGMNGREGLEDGTGSAAKFSYPKALQYHDGYYYVADGTNGALRRVTESGEVWTLAGVGHVNTPTFCACPRVPPAGGTYNIPSPFVFNPNAQEEAATAIMMDQVGGVAVLSRNVIYVSDYGYKCIWRISVH